MKYILTCIAIVSLFAVAGCDICDSCKRDCGCEGHKEVIMFEDFDDIHLFTDLAMIEDVWIEGDCIHLEVSFSGCSARTHEFELYCSANFMESYPVQTAMYLSHDGKGEACEAIFWRHLVFDLTPLRHAYLGGYHDRGPIRLRLHEPGMRDPIRPYPTYRL